MRLKVLIVPDKFKGTLTAQAAAELIALGWRQVRPGDELELLPMSDGGDGFGAVLADLLGLQSRTTQTVDAAHRPMAAGWWWNPIDRTCVIESARIIGLALLPPKQFHPFELDTCGLGPVLEAAARAGAACCLFGIGGSATNDGGFGLARALGWTFHARNGALLTTWRELGSLERIQPPERALELPELLVAVDVLNPLLGPSGATRVYGPQKGIRPEDFPIAELCLQRLAECMKRDFGRDLSTVPGTGAAGGLGYGLHCFLRAKLESGFRLFSRLASLESRIRQAGLVVTGEGAIDQSTLMGKGVGEVARLSQRCQVRCLGLAGTLSAELQSARKFHPFDAVHGMAPELTSIEHAQKDPSIWLPRLAAKAAAELGG